MTSFFTAKKITLAMTLASSFMAVNALATIVQIQTNLGIIDINLYDHDAAVKPTVDNFLNYASAAEGYGSYNDSIIHRSVKNFVIQGGGHTYSDTGYPSTISTAPAIMNAPVYSNIRGTISMAKVGNYPNSATNNWFINLVDNNVSLDANNAGYTVFGEVVNGMDIVDKIAALPIFIMGAFNEIPLSAYSYEDVINKLPLTKDNYVVVEKIVVIDANPNTAAALNPVKNTLITETEKKKSSSGSTGFGMLALLGMLLGLGLRARTTNA